MNRPSTESLPLDALLEVAALGSHSVRFVVRGSEPGRSGLVDVEDGVVRHAELGELTGREALVELLELPAASIEARALPPLLESAELEIPAEHVLRELGLEPGERREPATVPVATAPAGTGEGRARGGHPADVAFAEGVEAMLHHDHHAAVSAFRRVLELRPDDPRARHNLERLEAMLASREGEQS